MTREFSRADFVVLLLVGHVLRVREGVDGGRIRARRDGRDCGHDVVDVARAAAGGVVAVVVAEDEDREVRGREGDGGDGGG